MTEAIIFFTNGMEECEALVTLDLLRRADINIQSCSINESKKVKSSSNVELFADATIDEINFDDVKILILPGGMPGTINLAESDKVTKLCNEFNDSNKLIAAICAAPSILGQLNILNGLNATCYPGFEDKLIGSNKMDSGVVVDKNIITAEALGSVNEFAFAIIEKLKGADIAKEVSEQICIRN